MGFRAIPPPPRKAIFLPPRGLQGRTKTTRKPLGVIGNHTTTPGTTGGVLATKVFWGCMCRLGGCVLGWGTGVPLRSSCHGADAVRTRCDSFRQTALAMAVATSHPMDCTVGGGGG